MARITWEPWESVVSTALHSLERQRYSRANAYYDAMKQIQDVMVRVIAREGELQVTMEELQASNEEMEASNEELLASSEELQVANEEMERSNLFRRTVLDAMHDVLVVTDANGRITDINAEAERAFGHDPNALIGQSIEILFPSASNGGLAGILAAVEGDAAGEMRDAVGQRKDGSTFDLDMAVSAMQLGDQQWFVLVLRDITERKRTAAALAQKTDELARSNSELEQFAHLAAHELQEPLRMVVSYLRLLEQRYGGKIDSEADEFIGFSVDGAQRMHLMIEDLLKFALVQTEVDPYKQCDFERIAERTMTTLHTAIEDAKGKVTFGRLPIVMANPAQMAHVMQNLVGNAIKFGGKHVSVTAETEGDEWVFTVKDDGIGLPPGSEERIFHMFQRLHSREDYAGSGMGLAICKKIIDSYNGRIWVTSAINEGSTFCFTLPVMGMAPKGRAGGDAPVDPGARAS